jgi:hypothetical protein
MDHLQQTAEFLRKQLSEVELKIKTFDDENILTLTDIETLFSDMDKSKKWKIYIQGGVIGNILSILDECYDSYVEYIESEYPDKDPILFVGKYRSKLWTEFQILVLKKLLSPKDFDIHFDFEDTAGGCDEIAWDAGLDILKGLVLSIN